MDPKLKIGKTEFTIEFIIKTMKGKDSKWDGLIAHKRIQRVTIVPISDIGYLSFIYRIKFIFDEEIEQTFNVVLKVPTVRHMHTVNPLVDEEFLSVFGGKLSERHNKEINFYDQFSHLIKHVRLAKIYGAKEASRSNLEEGFILMEDLGEASIMPNFFEGLNKAQVETMIRTIAEIHAITLSIPNSEKILENFRFKGSMDQDDGQTKNFAVSALYQLPHDYFRHHKSALNRLCEENDIMAFDVHKVFGTPPVLCHGDYWSNNIFFEKDEEGKATNRIYALFDFQFAHPNTGLSDLLRLILICVNASVKLRYLPDWLNLYFETFSAACKVRGIPNPYTLKLVQQMFRYQYPSELLFAYIVLLNHYARAPDAGSQTCLLGRMISGFEYIRHDYETKKLQSGHYENDHKQQNGINGT